MLYHRPLIILIFSLLPVLAAHAHGDPSPTPSLATALATIDMITRSEGSADAHRRNIFDVCRIAEGTDARTLAFAVFNRDPAYKGTVAKIAVEVCLAHAQDLPRYVTPDAINAAIDRNQLTQLRKGNGIQFDKALPFERQYLTPWAATYLSDLAREYSMRYKDHLRITSLVRPSIFQQLLARTGKTPASCQAGALCGTHTTGATFDISLKTLTAERKGWLTERLAADMRDGKVLFIIEVRGGHFHVFMPQPPLPMEQ